jgi:hypothetical protein
MREAAARSQSVAAYMREAIAPSTRRTYDPAIANYRDYCESRGWRPDDPITEFTAEEWLASLADGGKLMFSTIRTYKAALSTWHEERSTLPNPLHSARVSRLLTGIENSKAAREAERRRDRPKTDGFDMSMLREVIKHYRDGTDKEVLFVGAAALLTAGAMRPGEVLGSQTAPPLLAEQISFFVKATDRSPIHQFSSLPDGAAPDHCIVSLRGSKTNRRQRREEIVIASPDAVRAIWAWRLRRHADSENELHGPELFKLPGRKPLRTANLIAFVSLGLRACGLGEFHLSGKCFRIGGTSTLAAAGADPADLRRLGRWRTNQWETYADPKSHQIRAREVNRRM